MIWEDAEMRFAFATGLPFLIGLERFLRRKPIDFRPFVIISVGSCGLVMASIEMLHTINDANSNVDPIRVIEGVITGIVFLGAGAMFREGNFIQGADRLHPFGWQAPSVLHAAWAKSGLR